MNKALNEKLTKPKIWQGVLNYFPLALAEVSKVSEDGAIKHENPLPDKGFMVDRYTVLGFNDAIARHLLALTEGEVNEDDNGAYHRAQIAWNALASLEKILREKEE